METQSIKSNHSLTNTNFKRRSFAARAQDITNPVTKRLCEIIEQKESNVAVNVDVTTKKEFLELVEKVAPYVCLIKTHIDILADFDWDTIEQLQSLAKKHHFLIFEDRKFADIGNTVRLQYQSGMYRIAEWADMVNAHALPGNGVIEGLQVGADGKERAVLLLAQMSSAGNLLDDAYAAKTIAMAQQYPHFVAGFIAQERGLIDDRFLILTPGVKLQAGTDRLGQQYNTPETAIDAGCDVLLIGRGVIAAENPIEEIQKYKAAAWDAYQRQL
jgi:orotidine 5'-phosphate decarboxylase subfamily 1